MANILTINEIALELIKSWRNKSYYNEGQADAALQCAIIDALKQRDSKVIASVTDALSKVLYER